VDRYSSIEKQNLMMDIIMTYYRKGAEAIKRGVTLVKLKRMNVLQDIVKMKFTIPNDQPEGFEKLKARLERSLDQLESIYG
jgi:V/A-type H+-transporting ATPase subunit A